jgi:hypothetical protein
MENLHFSTGSILVEDVKRQIRRNKRPRYPWGGEVRLKLRGLGLAAYFLSSVEDGESRGRH